MFARWGLRPMEMKETIGEVRKAEKLVVEAVKEAEQASTSA
jgi:hypothetical protein